MLKKWRAVGTAFLLISVVLTQSGCFALLVGAAAGAGAAFWVNGDLETNLDASVASAHRATIAGLKRLKLPITMDKQTLHDAEIRSSYADGTSVQIVIKSITEKTSKMHIRVGTVGDQVRSEAIMNSIQKYL